MSDSMDSNGNWPDAVINKVESTLLSQSIIVERIEFSGELKTWFVFVSTKGVSAVEIEPLKVAARQLNAEVKAVIDSDKDQLCFYFVSMQ